MLYFLLSSLKVPHVHTQSHTHSGKQRSHGAQCWDRRMRRHTHFHSHTPQSSLSIAASGVSLLYFPAARFDWPTKTILLTDWSSVRGFFSPHALRSSPTPFLSYSSSYAYYISQYVGPKPHENSMSKNCAIIETYYSDTLIRMLVCGFGEVWM